MNRNATAQIASDVREELNAIRSDLRRHLAPEVGVDHAKQLLIEHAPTLVVGRARLLLDSLLSYLMQDASEALQNAPTDVKNGFYALELRERIKGTFSLEAQSLQFSFDPRIMAGGMAASGTAVAGGLLVALLVSGMLSRIVGGLATLVASAFAFRAAHSASSAIAQRRIEDDVLEYLNASERQVASWLGEVENSFMETFNTFASTHGIRQEEP